MVISILANAPLVSIPVFILINYVESGGMFVLFSGVSVLFAGIIPILTIVLWSLKIKKISLEYPENWRPAVTIGMCNHFVFYRYNYSVSSPCPVAGAGPHVLLLYKSRSIRYHILLEDKYFILWGFSGRQPHLYLQSVSQDWYSESLSYPLCGAGSIFIGIQFRRLLQGHVWEFFLPARKCF